MGYVNAIQKYMLGFLLNHYFMITAISLDLLWIYQHLFQERNETEVELIN